MYSYYQGLERRNRVYVSSISIVYHLLLTPTELNKLIKIHKGKLELLALHWQIHYPDNTSVLADIGFVKCKMKLTEWIFPTMEMPSFLFDIHASLSCLVNSTWKYPSFEVPG